MTVLSLVRALSSIALVVLLTTVAIVSSSAATPAKRWFLNVVVWTHKNASLAPSGKNTFHMAGSFKTRDECLAKLRTIQKSPGLAYDINGVPIVGGGYGIAKIAGHCRPGPVRASAASE